MVANLEEEFAGSVAYEESAGEIIYRGRDSKGHHFYFIPSADFLANPRRYSSRGKFEVEIFDGGEHYEVDPQMNKEKVNELVKGLIDARRKMYEAEQASKRVPKKRREIPEFAILQKSAC
jgi:hypothetical protein